MGTLKNSEIPSSFLKLFFFVPCFSGVQGREAPLRRTYFGKNQNLLIKEFTMQFKGIIFDFDGTLANLTIDFEKIKRKILHLAEIFLDDSVNEKVRYLPLLECIDALTFEVKEINDELSKEFNTRCRLIVVDMEMRAARRGKLFEYTRPLLAHLKEKGIKIGVITRNCTPAVKMVFPDIEEWVDVFLPREDVTKVKPHPMHVEKALEKMGVKRHEAILIGDHPIDIICAKRAGVKSGAVSTGNVDMEELKKVEPDFVAENLKELFVKLIGFRI